MELSFAQLQALNDLFQRKTDEDVESEPMRHPSLNPGSFGPQSTTSATSNPDPNHKVVVKTKSASNPIWDDEEVNQSELSIFEDDPSDRREEPRYEILYKQTVTTEEVYLGMGGANPSTLDCNAMVVKVFLTGCSFSEVTLDVISTRMLVRSSRYKLSLYLPYLVNEKNGNAKWDSKKQILSVTLPIIRPDPFDG
eukprot:TRINITY_DN17459_c0_g1_i1.p1 TRINITY_DN17459_c0_g1~~TRINITY_DN17459_c0_g1_i1.p1  ORF type:complete len:216 (+),score=23.89 TRINITY_DN17459_c0_g1_i1:65-649(+)